jgi:hypothetical protein
MYHRHKPLDLIGMEIYPSSEFTEEQPVWRATVLWPQDGPLSGVTEGLAVWKWQTVLSCVLDGSQVEVCNNSSYFALISLEN